MGLTVGPLFSVAEQRLSWIDQRQQLLTENIANSDTPGYRPRDVAPFATLLDQSNSVTPLRSSERDLSPIQTAAGAQIMQSPSGASIDTNLGKLADTEGAQSLVLNLYSAYLGMFRTALDVGGGSSG